MAISWPLTFPTWTPVGKNYVPADDGRARDAIAKMGNRVGLLQDAVNELSTRMDTLPSGTDEAALLAAYSTSMGA